MYNKKKQTLELFCVTQGEIKKSAIRIANDRYSSTPEIKGET